MKRFIQTTLIVTTLFVGLSALALQGVNLNTATQQELEALPGVGEKMAAEIIAKRPFTSVEGLKDVKGIGEAKFAKLKDMVVVAEAAPAPVAAAVTEGAKKMNKAAATQLAPGEKVSLNSAAVEQLEKLPGIGPKKAMAIVQARPFASIEDVMKVKGIKAGIFNKIKPFLTL